MILSFNLKKDKDFDQINIIAHSEYGKLYLVKVYNAEKLSVNT